jgi:hypothetical protein
MAKKASKTRSKLNGQTYLMHRYLGVDARGIGLTLEQARELNKRSQQGQREAVRDQLLEMGAVDKGGLPDLTVPTFKQGMYLRKVLSLDIRPTNGNLTREQASGFIAQLEAGANGSVKDALLAMGAVEVE